MQDTFPCPIVTLGSQNICDSGNPVKFGSTRRLRTGADGGPYVRVGSVARQAAHAAAAGLVVFAGSGVERVGGPRAPLRRQAVGPPAVLQEARIVRPHVAHLYDGGEGPRSCTYVHG